MTWGWAGTPYPGAGRSASPGSCNRTAYAHIPVAQCIMDSNQKLSLPRNCVREQCTCRCGSINYVNEAKNAGFCWDYFLNNSRHYAFRSRVFWKCFLQQTRHMNFTIATVNIQRGLLNHSALCRYFEKLQDNCYLYPSNILWLLLTATRTVLINLEVGAYSTWTQMSRADKTLWLSVLHIAVRMINAYMGICRTNHKVPPW